MKKMIAIFLSCMIMVMCAACATHLEENTAKESTRVVTDMAGVEVVIPVTVERYVDSWAAHATIDLLLDNHEKMVGTAVPRGNMNSWVHLIAKNLEKSVSLEFSESMNVEEVAALKPDVVFGNVEAYRDMFAKVGIPYVDVSFNSFDTMEQSIRLVADILGGEAPSNADRYIKYLHDRLDWVDSKLSELNDEEKLSIVHGEPMYGLKIDGANTIIDEWIKYSGAINAATEVDGAKQSISIEQLLVWDPDVIISGDSLEDVDEITSDPAWKNLKAVKNDMVIVNPKGIFKWDRYGIEEALQVQWCASILYPQYFEGFDIREETKYFYREFLGYELTDDEVEKFMNHQEP